jgi:alkaline phosphatase D
LARPNGAAAHLYRTLDWGGLAQVQLIDDRQYRGPRACQPPELARDHKKYESLIRPCADLLDKERTMLGAAQDRWLSAALGRSRATWNLLAQQTLMSDLLRVDPDDDKAGFSVYSADTWSGYPAARARIVRRWAEARTPNPVALGRDVHAFAAADLRHPDTPGGRAVASEFVGGSITSLFHDPFLKAEAKNSRLAFAENEVHGYGRADIVAGRMDMAFRGLADATSEDSTISDIARFTIEAGRPGIQPG